MEAAGPSPPPGPWRGRTSSSTASWRCLASRCEPFVRACLPCFGTPLVRFQSSIAALSSAHWCCTMYTRQPVDETFLQPPCPALTLFPLWSFQPWKAKGIGWFSTVLAFCAAVLLCRLLHGVCQVDSVPVLPGPISSAHALLAPARVEAQATCPHLSWTSSPGFHFWFRFVCFVRFRADLMSGGTGHPILIFNLLCFTARSNRHLRGEGISSPTADVTTRPMVDKADACRVVCLPPFSPYTRPRTLSFFRNWWTATHTTWVAAEV